MSTACVIHGNRQSRHREKQAGKGGSYRFEQTQQRRARAPTLLEELFSGEDDLVSGCEPFSAKGSRLPATWLGPRLVNLIH